jgi:hypothetical protein
MVKLFVALMKILTPMIEAGLNLFVALIEKLVLWLTPAVDKLSALTDKLDVVGNVCRGAIPGVSAYTMAIDLLNSRMEAGLKKAPWWVKAWDFVTGGFDGFKVAASIFGRSMGNLARTFLKDVVGADEAEERIKKHKKFAGGSAEGLAQQQLTKYWGGLETERTWGAQGREWYLSEEGKSYRTRDAMLESAPMRTPTFVGQEGKARGRVAEEPRAKVTPRIFEGMGPQDYIESYRQMGKGLQYEREQEATRRSGQRFGFQHFDASSRVQQLELSRPEDRLQLSRPGGIRTLGAASVERARTMSPDPELQNRAALATLEMTRLMRNVDVSTQRSSREHGLKDAVPILAM